MRLTAASRLAQVLPAIVPKTPGRAPRSSTHKRWSMPASASTMFFFADHTMLQTASPAQATPSYFPKWTPRCASRTQTTLASSLPLRSCRLIPMLRCQAELSRVPLSFGKRLRRCTAHWKAHSAHKGSICATLCAYLAQRPY